MGGVERSRWSTVRNGLLKERSIRVGKREETQGVVETEG